MQLTTAQFEAMTDAELLTALFTWDGLRSWDSDYEPTLIEHNANGASQELEARCGEGADERLADYATASHASPQDLLVLASEETSLLMGIAKDAHVHTPANTLGYCKCGYRTVS